jgi:hypothetical protein
LGTNPSVKSKKTSTSLAIKQQSNKMVGIVKECKLIDISDEAIKNVIEFDTGIRVTNEQLRDLIETARREVREEQIEIDIHMEEMIKYGLYKDQMRQHSMLTRIEQIIYTMITEEAVKSGDEKNRNLILAMSNSLNKTFDTKGRIATNITFLSRTKHLLEQQLDENGGVTSTELGKKTTIMIKDKTEDVEKLVKDAIDVKELQNNRVA